MALGPFSRRQKSAPGVARGTCQTDNVRPAPRVLFSCAEPCTEGGGGVSRDNIIIITVRTQCAAAAVAPFVRSAVHALSIFTIRYYIIISVVFEPNLTENRVEDRIFIGRGDECPGRRFSSHLEADETRLNPRIVY